VRGDVALAASVLLAAALVLVAPLAGRAGHPRVADLLMVLAAACGIASFGMAARATLRAARRGASPPDVEEPRS
jgi:hypothetical protein